MSLVATSPTALARTTTIFNPACLFRNAFLRSRTYTSSKPPPHDSSQPPTSTHPSSSLTKEQKELLASMIRVDQAGEIGANWIYKGQLAVLGHDRQVGPIIQEMWDQEKKHLSTFDVLVTHHRVRPTALRPLWEIAGYALGAGTALMGKEAAMACTEAVETVIGEHYNDQLRELYKIQGNQDIVELSKIVKQFRDEELEHHDIAVNFDAKKAPFHDALSVVITQGCKAAIWIARKI